MHIARRSGPPVPADAVPSLYCRRVRLGDREYYAVTLPPVRLEDIAGAFDVGRGTADACAFCLQEMPMLVHDAQGMFMQHAVQACSSPEGQTKAGGMTPDHARAVWAKVYATPLIRLQLGELPLWYDLRSGQLMNPGLGVTDSGTVAEAYAGMRGKSWKRNAE